LQKNFYSILNICETIITTRKYNISDGQFEAIGIELPPLPIIPAVIPAVCNSRCMFNTLPHLFSFVLNHDNKIKLRGFTLQNRNSLSLQLLSAPLILSSPLKLLLAAIVASSHRRFYLSLSLSLFLCISNFLRLSHNFLVLLLLTS
jgi:hypothetical protein